MADITGTVAPQDGGTATVTSQPESSNGSESVASESSQEQETNAGGERSFSEGGKAEGTDTRKPQFKSKNQTIYELRQKMREQSSYWENEVGTLKQQLAEIQKMFGRGQNQKPSRTFWEAPEEVLDERISGHLSEMEKRILENLQQTRQNDQETSEWKQETSQAAKFIRDQKDLTEDDILEITDLVRENPTMQSMRPLERAEYALYLYQKNRGVSDKSASKAKAHMPAGAGSGGKERTWTEADINSEFSKLGDPKTWDADTKKKFDSLEREIRQAYRENRVRK